MCRPFGSLQRQPKANQETADCGCGSLCSMTGEAITGGRKKDFSPPGHGFSLTDLVRLVLFPVISTICHYVIHGHYTGQCVWIPNLPMGRSVMPWLLPSTSFNCNYRCFTWGGFRSSRSSSIDHQYIRIYSTLDKSQSGWKPAVCWLFLCWIYRWLGSLRRSRVAANRTAIPLAMVSVLLTWSG